MAQVIFKKFCIIQEKNGEHIETLGIKIDIRFLFSVDTVPNKHTHVYAHAG